MGFHVNAEVLLVGLIVIAAIIIIFIICQSLVEISDNRAMHQKKQIAYADYRIGDKICNVYEIISVSENRNLTYFEAFHKETKVVYGIFLTNGNLTMSVLYNSDGTIRKHVGE